MTSICALVMLITQADCLCAFRGREVVIQACNAEPWKVHNMAFTVNDYHVVVIPAKCAEA